MNSTDSVASRLQPRHRQEIAVKVLSQQEPIIQIAKQEQVSRKFVYQQKAIAQKFKISLSQVREVCLLMKKSLSTNLYWQKWNQLDKQISGKFLPVKEAVESAMKSIPRASSLVENLNSRLRNYFFLRKHLNSDYLDLLRFFLNHRTFLEGRVPERVGKSPKELMTGIKHPHWLEMLGFERFQMA